MSGGDHPAGHGPGETVLNAVHANLVFKRRVRVLARQLAALIPEAGDVLDLGCGDGAIAAEVMRLRPDLRIEGAEVLVRPGAMIPVRRFDGRHLPFSAGSFDYVVLVDVLHHTDDPEALMAEAVRVARKAIVIKDHLLSGFAARATLSLMDYVGNRGHGVPLPYNYLDDAAWQRLFRLSGCTVVRRVDRLGLYPPPFSKLFERHLHFMALLALPGGGLAQRAD